MRRAWVAVVIVASVFALLDWSVHRRRGLTRAAVDDATAEREYAASTVMNVNLDGVAPAIIARTGVSLVWRGFWEVPAADLYELRMESRGASTLKIDGHVAFEAGIDPQPPAGRQVWLTPGFHQIEIRYRPDPLAPHIHLRAGRAGASLGPIPSHALKPALPRNPTVRYWTGVARTGAGWLLAVLAILAFRRTTPTVGAWWRSRVGGLPRFASLRAYGARGAAWCALALILTYAALLRVDAITARYGPVVAPGWLASIQTRAVLPPQLIRPAWFPWVPAPFHAHADGPPTQYHSDPYTYLKAAREMTSFYEPTWREPLFPFSVRMVMGVVGPQDVAVSLTSAAFAVLAIWLTYLLGASVWSRPAGLLAAAVLAIDRDAAWFASQGWRDDAYVAAAVLGAFGILRIWRSARQPARQLRFGRFAVDALYLHTMLLGVAAGLIILVRIMSLSFLVPAAVLLVAGARGAWRRRLTMAGLGLATATIVAVPYFVNCWRVQGDFFYTFNVHGDIYRIAEGQTARPDTTYSYIRDKLSGRTYATVDTIVRGVTLYPFENKWTGLNGWRDGLGTHVAVASVAGLVVLAFVPAGRLVVLVAFASLLPFSLTWRVDPNPRFTLHLYPFFLIAASVAGSLAFRAIRAVAFPGIAAVTPPWRRDGDVTNRRNLARATSVVAGLSAVLWYVISWSPQLVFADALRHRDEVNVTAGEDGGFAGQGWTRPLDLGNIRMRVSTGDAEIRLRLPERDDYRLVLRLDPFPRPLTAAPRRLPVVEYALNGAPLGTIALAWNPDRIGSYDVRLPKEVVRAGTNTLVLRLAPPAAGSTGAAAGLTDGDAFGFWLLRASRPPA